MTVTYVGFVRAVMIGREGLHREVLLDMFERAGAASAVSYISTGNVSFECDPARLADIVDAVESDLAALLDRYTEVFVRSHDELRSMHDSDPFATSPDEQPDHRLVTMFRRAVPDTLNLPIESPKGYWVAFAAGPREVFSVTREIDGRTQDPGGVIERLADERATTRAWSTIERIRTKLDD